MKINTILVLALTFTILSCNSSNEESESEKAQHNESLWSSFHGNPSNTGFYSGEETNVKGKLKWKFETRDDVSSSPVVYKGMVYCGSDDNNLYAIDAQTGKEKWKFENHSVTLLFFYI